MAETDRRTLRPDEHFVAERVSEYMQHVEASKTGKPEIEPSLLDAEESIKEPSLLMSDAGDSVQGLASNL